ncbi:MAG: hypothetical protein HWN66_07235 [Candidatus Helarchaeota archaeon]|nr:hypothetical protein [Candidatus Helarchaeota archaeon]
MSIRSLAEKAFEQGGGILRLAPNWVPRAFCIPGRRIKLHPDDYYALGGDRGGIDERWFASTTPADNGPLTAPNEGLSFVVFKDGTEIKQILLGDVIGELKDQLIGKRLWEKYGSWPVYAKFFDNQGPLPFHIHHRGEHAKLLNQMAKHEAYYFPPQVNNHCGDFPYTFFGFQPGVKKEQIRECLLNFSKGDNKITNLSKAYHLEVGTGWDVPPGILHAPGSLCTYEPQQASDVFAMFQSLTGNQLVPEELLWKGAPEEKMGDIDFLIELIDWDLNVDPDFRSKRFMKPKTIKNIEKMKAEGYIETWICYKSSAFSAKELTILPGEAVIIHDNAAYGLIMLQGYGTLNEWTIETPTLIRYGQLTNDEFFVSESAAKQGVNIKNQSEIEQIVMLKHFGPKNPDLKL